MSTAVKTVERDSAPDAPSLGSRRRETVLQTFRGEQK